MSSNQPDLPAIRSAIAEIKDPETGRSIATVEEPHGLYLKGDQLFVVVQFSTWSAPLAEQVRVELAEHLRKRFPTLKTSVEIAIPRRKPDDPGGSGLAAKTIVAVAAGKGGVGKSSIAAYLACGLQRAGCQVGLLDADLYGPSIPLMFGCHQPPQMIGDRIQPVTVDGLRLLSIGLLVPENEAVIWRGPMLHTALSQFLRDTAWGDLDYLVIDMPPGTGDVAISLAQLLPLSGAIVVCTPQDVALLDAVKAVTMFRKVNIDVLGMVENMSFFTCPDCNARHEIFGSGGARRRAAQLGVPFLGEVPICTELRVGADQGRIAAAFDHPIAGPCLEAICRNFVGNLAVERRAHPKLPTLPILR
jgi:ATP-binding protein involved in chromosome partitioning